MDKEEDIGFILIDAPVGRYSPIEEIQSWVVELKRIPDRPEVRQEIKQAEDWLKRA